MIMKIRLKRIKKSTPLLPNVPDYESFFKGNKGKIFYVVGYLKPLSSDLDLVIKEADLENHYQRKKYVEEWRGKI
jgi:hypothetical protein